MWIAITNVDETFDAAVEPASARSSSTTLVDRLTETFGMHKPSSCKHRMTRFHSIQQLGDQPGLELRQCMRCHTTIAVTLPSAQPIEPSAVD